MITTIICGRPTVAMATPRSFDERKKKKLAISSRSQSVRWSVNSVTAGWPYRSTGSKRWMDWRIQEKNSHQVTGGPYFDSMGPFKLIAILFSFIRFQTNDRCHFIDWRVLVIIFNIMRISQLIRWHFERVIQHRRSSASQWIKKIKNMKKYDTARNWWSFWVSLNHFVSLLPAASDRLSTWIKQRGGETFFFPASGARQSDGNGPHGPKDSSVPSG